jgi:hypothetical protein
MSKTKTTGFYFKAAEQEIEWRATAVSLSKNVTK